MGEVGDTLVLQAVLDEMVDLPDGVTARLEAVPGHSMPVLVIGTYVRSVNELTDLARQPSEEAVVNLLRFYVEQSVLSLKDLFRDLADGIKVKPRVPTSPDTDRSETP